MKILSVSVLIRKDATDLLMIAVDLPNPLPGIPGHEAVLTMHAQKGTGAAYSRAFLNVEPKIIQGG